MIIIKKIFIKLINTIMYYYYLLFPINNYLIVMESEPDLSDNTYALFHYMSRNNYLKKYKVVWLVENLESAKKSYHNVKFLNKYPKKIDIERSKYLATCKYYIYDHCNVMRYVYKRRDCIILNLWHGCGFKAEKKEFKLCTNPTKTIITGKLFYPIFIKTFNYKKNDIIDLGYPRNQYLFSRFEKEQNYFFNLLHLQDYNKIIFWMPTFRRSINKEIDENYFESETGLPIIKTKEMLEEFDHVLSKKNIICIFKLHHLQSELNVFENKYSNIIVINDKILQKYNIQLYQIIPISDCLITDYSSIFVDYLLLNKPIIFTIDDYEEYKKSRGFNLENAIDYFAGYHVVSYDELISSITEVNDGIDKYKSKRNEILDLMQTYKDGNASKRIIELLGIKN